MIYREAGDFKTSYRDDSQTFPIRLDRWGYYAILAVAFGIIPFVINDYWANAVLVPFLIYAIAALGLNVLTGYAGQVSLGTGGFMAVGAYAVYKLMTAFPDVSIVIHILLAGGITAGVGVLFGLPSLRYQGLLSGRGHAGRAVLSGLVVQQGAVVLQLFGLGPDHRADAHGVRPAVTGPAATAPAKYLICLVFAFVLAWVARNLTRGSLGRKWMAIRDMDIAAEIIGVNPLRAKLSAFAVSSFFIGIAGALLFAVYLGAAEVGEAFGINKSFLCCS